MSLVELAEKVIAQHANGGRCRICCQQFTTGRDCRQVRLANRLLSNADRSTTDTSARTEIESTVRRSTTEARKQGGPGAAIEAPAGPLIAPGGDPL